MSKPRGTVLPCTDDEQCLFCQAREAALASHDPRQNQSANNWGRKRRQFLYNCFNLSDPRANWYKDNQMRPLVLGASPMLQRDLAKLFQNRGFKSIVDYQGGRPVKIMKKKTGPEDINVEWSALDMNPAPLDQYFWAATYQLWDLTKEIDAVDTQLILRVIQELGLPMPGGQGQQTASYNPAAQPPYNPQYQQQQPQYQQQQPQYQQQQPPPQQYLPQQATGPMAPPMNPAQQAPMYQPPVGSLPPPPPAVQSNLGGVGMAPPPPPMTAPGGSQMPPLPPQGPPMGFNPPPPPPPMGQRPY
jgi:hypothetical protein